MPFSSTHGTQTLDASQILGSSVPVLDDHIRDHLREAPATGQLARQKGVAHHQKEDSAERSIRRPTAAASSIRRPTARTPQKISAHSCSPKSEQRRKEAALADSTAHLTKLDVNISVWGSGDNAEHIATCTVHRPLPIRLRILMSALAHQKDEHKRKNDEPHALAPHACICHFKQNGSRVREEGAVAVSCSHMHEEVQKGRHGYANIMNEVLHFPSTQDLLLASINILQYCTRINLTFRIRLRRMPRLPTGCQGARSTPRPWSARR